MKEIQQQLVEYIKTINVQGCITGSCLLPEYYEESDVDVFLYSPASFLKIYYTLRLNPMFTILEPVELWKADRIEKENLLNNKHSSGVTTLKLYYNTCIPVNIILKKNCSSIFDILASFDMSVICKGFDLRTKQYLDLTEGSIDTKIASWNKWNPAFYSEEIWQISRILRQLIRCVKYHKRGFNTDTLVLKYIELINKLQEYENIFSSENFSEKLKITKENTLIVKEICKVWLATHEITEDQLELMNEKIKMI